MKRHGIVFFLVVIFVLLETKCFSQTEYHIFTYPNGQVSSEGLLRDGRPDSLWKTYYENGQLKSIGIRRDFLLDSTWIFFTETGDTNLVINYRKDLKNGMRYLVVVLVSK